MDKKLYSHFGRRVRLFGDERLLPIESGIEFALLCDDYDLAIIGIECFALEGQYRRPLLNLIADFSDALAFPWTDGRERCKQASLKFFSENSHENAYCTFIVFDKDKWEAYKRRS